MKNFLLLVLISLIFPSQVHAATDPLSVPNNKFGIHIISGSVNEASPAAELANSSGGDWGYLTIVIESKDRDVAKWQSFFNQLRRKHLIPLVRIATGAEKDYWKRPTREDARLWAAFLAKLNWPTKNRYVIIYNEPNHAKEWGNSVDARHYARILKETIAALKQESSDFFVLNAGLDASAPDKFPDFADEVKFLRDMQAEIPGIFNDLDGWVSHSYPNPNFTGSPADSGRGTVRTYLWEREVLSGLGLTKDLPVLITETGWQHAEGLKFDRTLPSSEKVGAFLLEAFSLAWNHPRIVAVTPFLLTYTQPPFDRFSFKRLPEDVKDNTPVLGAAYPDFYPQYQLMASLIKPAGLPYQDDRAELVQGEIPEALVIGEAYELSFVFKNTGQSIWGERGSVWGKVESDALDLESKTIGLRYEGSGEPGEKAVGKAAVQFRAVGKREVTLTLYNGGKRFDQNPFHFTVEVKPPVMVQIAANLSSQKTAQGVYTLTISPNEYYSGKVQLTDIGQSSPYEMRTLLPDRKYAFTLSRDFYRPKTIQVRVRSGFNTLDFGELQPDFIALLKKPSQIWRLWPFGNR